MFMNLHQLKITYICKALATLVRKKISEFLEYFIQHEELLVIMVKISYFPSVAHLIAKMLTDDEDNLTDRALSVK